MAEIEKTIELKAPVDRVWRALTDHREFGEWFRLNLPDPFVAGARVIGKVTYPGYEHVTWEVTIREMIAPVLFSFTWHPYAVDPAVDYSTEEPTLVEFRLKPIAGGTHLTITESGFDKVPAGRRIEALRMNEGGWAEQSRNIQAHVER